MDNQNEQNNSQGTGADKPHDDGAGNAPASVDEDPATLKKELGDLGIEINPDDSRRD